MLLLWELLGRFGFSMKPGDRLRDIYNASGGNIEQFCCSLRNDASFKNYHAMSRAEIVELFRALQSEDFERDARAICDALNRELPKSPDGPSPDLLQVLGLSWIDPEFVDQLKTLKNGPVEVCGRQIQDVLELVNEYYGFAVTKDEILALQSVYLTEGPPRTPKTTGFIEHRIALHLHWSPGTSGMGCGSAMSCIGLSQVDRELKAGFIRETPAGASGPAVVRAFKENGKLPRAGPFYMRDMGGQDAEEPRKSSEADKSKEPTKA